MPESFMAARERLLDLTLRNRLLNFRPSKQRTIHVIDEIPKEIFDILVLKERMMQFKPSEQPVKGERLHDPWLRDTTQPADHHSDRFLQTNLLSEDLRKRLYYVHNQARSVFEEQGYLGPVSRPRFSQMAGA